MRVFVVVVEEGAKGAGAPVLENVAGVLAAADAGTNPTSTDLLEALEWAAGGARTAHLDAEEEA